MRLVRGFSPYSLRGRLGIGGTLVRARVSDYNDLRAGGEACKGDEGARSEGREEEPC